MRVNPSATVKRFLVVASILALPLAASGSSRILSAASHSSPEEVLVKGKHMTLYLATYGAPSVAFGLGGDLWFGTPLVRFSARGRGYYRTYSIRHDDVNAITLGPDGKSMWFTPSFGHFVGHIDERGKVKYIKILQKRAFGSSAIAAGPDGRVWFGAQDRDGPFVGAISISGQLQQYAIASAPRTLAPGPNALMWFGAGSAIGSIASSSQITTYSVDGQVDALVNGSDGNMWFCAQGASNVSQIGRFEPGSGNVTYFALPSQSKCGNAMTVAADGALYMPLSESTGPAIVSVAPSGATTIYPIPLSGSLGCCVSGITANRNGKFVYLAFNYVGVVVKLSI